MTVVAGREATGKLETLTTPSMNLNHNVIVFYSQFIFDVAGMIMCGAVMGGNMCKCMGLGIMYSPINGGFGASVYGLCAVFKKT